MERKGTSNPYAVELYIFKKFFHLSSELKRLIFLQHRVEIAQLTKIRSMFLLSIYSIVISTTLISRWNLNFWRIYSFLRLNQMNFEVQWATWSVFTIGSKHERKQRVEIWKCNEFINIFSLSCGIWWNLAQCKNYYENLFLVCLFDWCSNFQILTQEQQWLVLFSTFVVLFQNHLNGLCLTDPGNLYLKGRLFQ